MKVLAAILAIAVIGLALAYHETEQRNSELNKRIDDLARAVQQKGESVSRSASLELQGRCAKQAQEEFNRSGLAKEQIAGFENHYNQKLNKCFVLYSSTSVSHGKPTVYMQLMDAFEGKGYANYYWINSSGKQYWEVKPFVCKVTSIDGDEKNCASSDEFNSMIKSYMND